MKDEILKKDRCNKIRAEIWKLASDDSLSEGELIQNLLNIIGPAIGVSRACYNELMGEYPHRMWCVCTMEWCAEGVRQSIGEKVPEFIMKYYLKEDYFILTEQSVMDMIPTPVRPLAKPIIDGIKKRLNLYKVIVASYSVGDKVQGLLSFDVCRDKEKDFTWTDEKKEILLESVQIVSNRLSRRKAEEERDKLYLQLSHSEKMSGIGTLAAGIAHEFNNMLQIISGNAQIAHEMGDEREIRKALGVILDTSRRAAKIVSDLLVFSRSEIVGKKNYDVNKIIEEILSLVESHMEKQNIKIIRKYGKIPKVNINKTEIQQVFLNLVTNARDAMMPKGGTLKIETARHHDMIRIRFTDTGRGIEKENINRIFEPFYTTKGAMGRKNSMIQGTGMGLAVSYGVMNRHDGNIYVESTGEKGTVFTVEVPQSTVTDELLTDVQKSVITGKERGFNNVFVIDDEKRVCEMITNFLSNRGYEVKCAGSGKEAMERFRVEKFGIVLLDMLVPGVMWKELLKMLREISPETRIIIITGQIIDKNLIREFKKIGVKKYLQKPLEMDKLLETMKGESCVYFNL